MSSSQPTSDTHPRASGKKRAASSDLSPAKRTKLDPESLYRELHSVATSLENDWHWIRKAASSIRPDNAKEKYMMVYKVWSSITACLAYLRPSLLRDRDFHLDQRFNTRGLVSPETQVQIDSTNELLDRITSSWNKWRDSLAENDSTSIDYVEPPLCSPSYFSEHWPKLQLQSNTVLCYRPADRIAAPLCSRHIIFADYLDRISSSKLPSDADAHRAFLAAESLLKKMGDSFPSEKARGEAFNKSIVPCFPSWVGQWNIQVGDTLGKIDHAFFGLRTNQSYPLIVREDKNEAGTSGDDQMQLVGTYVLLARMGAKDPRASALLENGFPIFLVGLLGPRLEVMGGFFDGRFCTVEPLGSPISMLKDGRGMVARRKALTRVLYGLLRAAQDLERLQSEGLPAPRRLQYDLPEIYRTCHSYKSGVDYDLFLEGRSTSDDSESDHPLYRATSPQLPDKSIIVMLSEEPYGDVVHCALAAKGYAPSLYAFSDPKGAPKAYVMEELAPNEWSTLADLRNKQPESYDAQKTAVWNGLNRILDFLATQKFVHGDIRPENVMISIDSQGEPCIEEGSAKLKLVGFHWAGTAGKVEYPPEQDRKIFGRSIEPQFGLINPGADHTFVKSWLGSDEVGL